MPRKYFLQYFLAAILIGLSLLLLLRANNFKLLTNITFVDILVSVSIAIVLYIISGLQYLILMRKYQTKMSWWDVLLLPISMNLWSFIIPVQGSLLYGTALLRCKYKIRVSGSLAINIYSYLISIFIAGIIGLFFVIRHQLGLSGIFFVSILFVLSPVIIFLLNYFFRHQRINNKFLGKIQEFVFLTVNNASSLYKDWRTTTVVLLINIFHTAISVWWYYWIVVVLHINLSFISVVMLMLLAKVSLIFRLTPGNLGVEQLASSGLVVLLGGRGADGALISLFIALTTVLIVFSLGTISTISNLKYFETKNWRAIFQILKIPNH